MLGFAGSRAPATDEGLGVSAGLQGVQDRCELCKEELSRIHTCPKLGGAACVGTELPITWHYAGQCGSHQPRVAVHVWILSPRSSV